MSSKIKSLAIESGHVKAIAFVGALKELKNPDFPTLETA
jgi:hypothetical protein